MRLLKLFFVVGFLLVSNALIGQTVLRGKVTNTKGEPVKNTLVFLDTIKTNAVSNAHGYFRVKVPKDINKITLYSPKYGFMSTPYVGDKKVSFVFVEPIEKQENSQVVIGYGSQEEDKLTSSVNTLDAKNDKNTVIYANIYEYIRGRVAGVKVTNNNQIVIRGVSSFNLSNEPLFVVDGVVVSNIDFVIPVDVDKITILKGSSASIYGSRGANGVLVITTKHN